MLAPVSAVVHLRTSCHRRAGHGVTAHNTELLIIGGFEQLPPELPPPLPSPEEQAAIVAQNAPAIVIEAERSAEAEAAALRAGVADLEVNGIGLKLLDEVWTWDVETGRGKWR